jgi:hypothetical protein
MIEKPCERLILRQSDNQCQLRIESNGAHIFEGGIDSDHSEVKPIEQTPNTTHRSHANREAAPELKRDLIDEREKPAQP